MIYVTKLNNKEIMINNDLIETIERTPDTVITMTSGKKYVVIESPEEIRKKVIEFRKNTTTK